jgi:hypothetical protein
MLVAYRASSRAVFLYASPKTSATTSTPTSC